MNPYEEFKKQNENTTNSGINPLLKIQGDYKKAGEKGIENGIPNNWLIKFIQQMTDNMQQRPETTGSTAMMPNQERYRINKNFWSNRNV